MTAPDPLADVIQQEFLDRILFVGGAGEGLPVVRDDVGKFVLMGVPAEMIAALARAAREHIAAEIEDRLTESLISDEYEDGRQRGMNDAARIARGGAA